jgi:RNA polymerase sigma-70 factor, ECF subfamily
MATMLADTSTASTGTGLDLVRRAQQGDVAAFERLYREHVDRVFALCLRLSADAERAEELAQDVFVRAWEKLDTFQGRSAFSTWLHRLAVNVVLGDRRSEKVRVSRVFGTETPEGFEAPPDAAPLDPADRLDLERAIAKLPPGARAVLVLHDVEGYRHEEIARMQGTAVGTCKAQLHRARKLLREMLGR